MQNIRHRRILELIQEYPIEKQEDLVKRLQKEGFSVTQATVSRDIKFLNLTKTSFEGKNIYTQIQGLDQADASKYGKIFKESVVSIRRSGNILVLKTISGTANSACGFLDNLENDSILGNVAGDDTIIMVIESEAKAKVILKILREYIE